MRRFLRRAEALPGLEKSMSPIAPVIAPNIDNHVAATLSQIQGSLGKIPNTLATLGNASVPEAILKSDNATVEVFRKLRTGSMSSLYLLSFLLTGNRKDARRCFVAGVAGCVDENRVFKKWATSWARSIIVHNAIQIQSPHAGPPRPGGSVLRSATDHNLSNNALQYGPFANVLALGDFERFVYVLSVLEGYIDRECSVLLNSSLQEIEQTRSRALQHMAEVDSEGTLRQK